MRWWLVPSNPSLYVNFLEKTFDLDKIKSFKLGRLSEEVFQEQEYELELSTLNESEVSGDTDI